MIERLQDANAGYAIRNICILRHFDVFCVNPTTSPQLQNLQSFSANCKKPTSLCRVQRARLQTAKKQLVRATCIADCACNSPIKGGIYILPPHFMSGVGLGG